MSSIKGTGKSQGTSSVSPTQGSEATSQAPSSLETDTSKGSHREQESGNTYSPEVLGKLSEIRQSSLNASLVGGAAGLFTDGVFFPPNLLDINDPANDVHYLRLMAAVLGMEELERYFRLKQGLPDEDDEEWDDESSDDENILDDLPDDSGEDDLS